MRLLLVVVALNLLLGLGCGSSKRGDLGDRTASKVAAKQEEPPAKDVAAPAPAGGQPQAQPVERKIIYTATLQLLVDDFAGVEQRLTDLVKAHQGYVAQSNVSNSPSAPRRGNWTVRIPIDQFDAFRAAVAKLGDVEQNRADAEDITDKYYDLESHIKNKEKTEERLREHLKKSTAALADILTVERELERVRGEIELQQGQLQRLGKLTAMTTVTVTIQERPTPVLPPPPPPKPPTFGETIIRTFAESFNVEVGLGKGLVLVGVAMAPWVPVVALLVIPIWLVSRRHRRRSTSPLHPQVSQQLVPVEPKPAAGTPPPE